MPADGAEVYDQIMGAMEPELTNAERGGLEEKYKNETPEEREARYTRYEAAYQEYDRQFALWQNQQQSSIHTFKQIGRAHV